MEKIYNSVIRHVDQAKKLDTILGFAERCGNFTDSIRRLLEDKAKTETDSLSESLPSNHLHVVANA
jgi:bacterioferritin-associated ferredoxin